MTTKNPTPDRIALTTSQAAEYCFVSQGTILNWIKSGKLPCQRTAGGQNRIRAEQLRAFMVEQGMSTEALDTDCHLWRRCFCWEYFARSGKHAGRASDCASCIVRQSRAMNCYELRNHVDHSKVHCAGSCDQCAYKRAFAEETVA